MFQSLTRRVVTTGCVCSLIALGGYALSGPTLAGAQSPQTAKSGSPNTSCPAPAQKTVNASNAGPSGLPKAGASAASVEAKLDTAKARSADASCPGLSKPPSAAPDQNNPKLTALTNMASSLGITMQQLQQAFDSAASQGVTTLDDPRMARAVASAAGLDRGAVQQALQQVIATIQQANAQRSR